jgi:hypothetical protein
MLLRRTVIVDEPLAFQTRRFEAARAAESGLQILSLPQVAARLAGGLLSPITLNLLDPAIRDALDEGKFAELESV